MRIWRFTPAVLLVCCFNSIGFSQTSSGSISGTVLDPSNASVTNATVTLMNEQRHSVEDELRWLDSEGPVSRRLLDRIKTAGEEFDFLLVFSARYYHAYHTARTMPHRTILVPTAEREPSIGLR